MKIHSVLIDNYKGINASIVLNDGINVITGENGTGKSNILEAIRIALGENISFSPNAFTKEKTFASIRITLADKSLLLDKYTIFKKLYKSGRVKTYINDELPDNNIDCILLDYDSHCFMNQEKLSEFIQNLKEQAKTKQIIIVSLSNEVIETADCVYRAQRIGESYTLTQNKAVA